MKMGGDTLEWFKENWLTKYNSDDGQGDMTRIKVPLGLLQVVRWKKLIYNHLA